MWRRLRWPLISFKPVDVMTVLLETFTTTCYHVTKGLLSSSGGHTWAGLVSWRRPWGSAESCRRSVTRDFSGCSSPTFLFFCWRSNFRSGRILFPQTLKWKLICFCRTSWKILNFSEFKEFIWTSTDFHLDVSLRCRGDAPLQLHCLNFCPWANTVGLIWFFWIVSAKLKL